MTTQSEKLNVLGVRLGFSSTMFRHSRTLSNDGISVVDSFYTPVAVAQILVGNAKLSSTPSFVADFTVGEGELLKAAEERWPTAKLVGLDINSLAIRKLRRTHPHWSISKVDFLDSASRSRCTLLKLIKNTIPLIVLNPPFSCRGSGYRRVIVHGTRFNCSVAMAFLLTSISFLTPDGQILAILPRGSLQSIKDRPAWDYLSRVTLWEVVGETARQEFPGCHARATLVRLTLRKRPALKAVSLSSSPTIPTRQIGSVEIIRGTIQTHTVKAGINAKAIPFVHSTELNNCVNLTARRIVSKGRTIVGPAILLPRVGMPSRKKLCLYLNQCTIALSDCVLGIKCTNPDMAIQLQKQLLNNWTRFEQLYGGTCAPYTTIEALKSLLSEYGYSVR